MISSPTRIVILGGGFGGVYTARGLERCWGNTPGVQVTLVSRNNYFLMTPLLFEAGSGVLEPRHAVNPLRPLFHKTRFVEALVTGVDVERKVVTLEPPGGDPEELPYDHLVLALGGVTNTKLIPGSEHGLTFKTLADAIFLRNHVIQLLERADIEDDPQRKAALLTFVLVGGGLVNIELCGELTSFLHTVIKLYPHVSEHEVSIHMIEGEPSIGREFDESLREYIADVLKRRRVDIRTSTRVKAIEPGRIHLPDGTTFETETIILGTGVVPNPLVGQLPIEKDKKGRAMTEPTMRCKGRSDIWALGDCASIPNPQGQPYPTLAQHAIREGKLLAKNITAAIQGKPLAPFVYETKGTLAALGHYKGAGKIYKFNIRGFIAWWVWRSYYLMQMPRWDRRFRILLDWTVALFFRNDVVQMDLFGEQHPIQARMMNRPANDGRTGGPPPGASAAAKSDGNGQHHDAPAGPAEAARS